MTHFSKITDGLSISITLQASARHCQGSLLSLLCSQEKATLTFGLNRWKTKISFFPTPGDKKSNSLNCPYDFQITLLEVRVEHFLPKKGEGHHSLQTPDPHLFHQNLLPGVDGDISKTGSMNSVHLALGYGTYHTVLRLWNTCRNCR